MIVSVAPECSVDHRIFILTDNSLFTTAKDLWRTVTLQVV